MATYCEARGESRDGVCYCGTPATTEVSAGWWHSSRNGVGGGVYTEVCERCYQEEFKQPDGTDEVTAGNVRQ